MMIASGLVGLSALDEQVGVIFVLLYLYYSIVSDGYYLVANMSVCGPIPNNSTAHPSRRKRGVLPYIITHERYSSVVFIHY